MKNSRLVSKASSYRGLYMPNIASTIKDLVLSTTTSSGITEL